MEHGEPERREDNTSSTESKEEAVENRDSTGADTQKGDTSEDLKNTDVTESTEISEEKRIRTKTAKFKEHELEQHRTKYRQAVSKYRREAARCEKMCSQSPTCKDIQKASNELQEEMTHVQTEYDILRSLLGDEDKAERRDIWERYDDIEHVHYDLKKTLSKMMNDLTTKDDDAASVCSQRSRKSRRSSCSMMSTSSLKAEAAAEAASLQAKLKYIDVERKKRAELEERKVELEKIQTMKELEVAQARLNALSEVDEERMSVVSAERDDIVKNFIDSMPDEPVVKQSPKLNPHAPVYNPDDNSFQSQSSDIQELAKIIMAQSSLARLPPPEPGIFTGDPLKYAEWKSSFATLIGEKNIPDEEKIHYLKRYIGGEAKEAVEGFFLMNSENAYEDAKALLDERFGDQFVITNAFRDKLDKWPRIGAKDGLALRRLSDFLRQCESAKHRNQS